MIPLSVAASLSPTMRRPTVVQREAYMVVGGGGGRQIVDSPGAANLQIRLWLTGVDSKTKIGAVQPGYTLAIIHGADRVSIVRARGSRQCRTLEQSARAKRTKVAFFRGHEPQISGSLGSSAPQESENRTVPVPLILVIT
ncbi:hypothetical protein J6590_020707 [Homalodisca vitripennis]|nr:hypothetical protein J6590_020707 [Homalodisca vitripennis]